MVNLYMQSMWFIMYVQKEQNWEQIKEPMLECRKGLTYFYKCAMYTSIYKCKRCRKKYYIKLKFQKNSHACIYPECLHSTCTGTVFWKERPCTYVKVNFHYTFQEEKVGP